MFPPSESTYALHELIHVGAQTEITGPPRFNSLFMFERVNLYLKRMIKNKHSHAASIIKAYGKQEFITQIIGYKFDRLSKIIEILSCMPTNYNLVKKLYHHLLTYTLTGITVNTLFIHYLIAESMN